MPPPIPSRACRPPPPRAVSRASTPGRRSIAVGYTVGEREKREGIGAQIRLAAPTAHCTPIHPRVPSSRANSRKPSWTTSWPRSRPAAWPTTRRKGRTGLRTTTRCEERGERQGGREGSLLAGRGVGAAPGRGTLLTSLHAIAIRGRLRLLHAARHLHRHRFPAVGGIPPEWAGAQEGARRHRRAAARLWCHRGCDRHAGAVGDRARCVQRGRAKPNSGAGALGRARRAGRRAARFGALCRAHLIPSPLYPLRSKPAWPCCRKSSATASSRLAAGRRTTRPKASRPWRQTAGAFGTTR